MNKRTKKVMKVLTRSAYYYLNRSKANYLLTMTIYTTIVSSLWKIFFNTIWLSWINKTLFGMEIKLNEEKEMWFFWRVSYTSLKISPIHYFTQSNVVCTQWCEIVNLPFGLHKLDFVQLQLMPCCPKMRLSNYLKNHLVIVCEMLLLMNLINNL